MKSKFISELYKLSKEPIMLDFFDKIKSACEEWIDLELKLPYKLSLIGENGDKNRGLYIGFNKPDGETLSEIELNKEISDLENFEKKFLKRGKKKNLFCTYNDKGDFEIYNDY